MGGLVEAVPELAEVGTRSPATIIGLLDERLPDPIAEAEQSITVATAEGDVARHLGCEAHRPLLRIDRTYHTTTGRAVELAVSCFLSEHYSDRVRLRRNVRRRPSAVPARREVHCARDRAGCAYVAPFRRRSRWSSPRVP